MSRWRLSLAIGSVLLTATGASAVPVNVTLNKPVTLTGLYGVLRPASSWATNPVAPAQSVDDGIFRPEGTDWNDGSIWWDATVTGSENNSITIDLLGTYDISGIITQADNNDNYQVDYFSPVSSSWVGLGHWLPIGGYGLTTRPSSDQMTPLPISFRASAIRLSAFNDSNGGDSYFSYSEFQAFGEPVPEPSTILLLGSALVAVRRRFRSPRS